MTATLTRPRSEQGNNTKPPILHWLDPKRPGYALCGWKITKVVGGIDEAECVVCETLKRSG